LTNSPALAQERDHTRRTGLERIFHGNLPFEIFFHYCRVSARDWMGIQ
jgi:hypothetical protein